MKRFSYSFFLKGNICARNEKGYQWNLQSSLLCPADFVDFAGQGGAGQGLLFGEGLGILFFSEYPSIPGIWYNSQENLINKDRESHFCGTRLNS